jgi:dihydroxy-acid dehydratase
MALLRIFYLDIISFNDTLPLLNHPQKKVNNLMRSEEMIKGNQRAPHRSLFKAMGFTDEELQRPLIGVANSFNELIPGHIHLNRLAQAIKEGIRHAGGTPFEFNTIGLCDGIAMGHNGMKYSLPSRELVADSVETMATAYPFDGLVLLADCDKIVPGMLMAALRLNIPAVYVAGGPMLAGRHNQNDIDLITVFEGRGQVANKKMSETELKQMENEACPSCGSCAGMFTANSMNCLSEVLGLGLPGNGTHPAPLAKRTRLAKKAGMKVMELVQKDIRPRAIADLEAFKNAIAVDMALGASTNTVLHLPAIANEAGLGLDLALFNEYSQKTPHLCNLSPAGPHHIEELDRAGGIPAVMKELLEKNLINGNCLTVTGQTVAENLAPVAIQDTDIIRPLDNPYHKQGGLAILYGNLAPNGAVVKQSAVADEMLQHSGPARIFDSEEEAITAIIGGKIKKGDVVVIRYEGPRGGPGMREMLSPTSAVVGMGLDKDVALITDGRFSGGTRGAAIGHISPEAALKGPIAAVNEGDIVEIDIPARKLNVKLDDKTIQERVQNLGAFEPKIKTGYLRRYSQMVQSADTGAILA